ncbi:hypothetical protein HDU76_001044 [Blyttiomyces sp. JEL0837]|nr:hypothetical protein HDU76_001044 [Blyttiomyces sp. JEL0837]
MRPDLDGIQHLQQTFNDSRFWKKLEVDAAEWDLSFLQIHDSAIPKLLIHIPMRQYWMDELFGLDDLDQLKLFFVAGCCGHFQLFQHLYDRVILHDQHQLSLDTSTSTPPTVTLSKLFSLILHVAAQRGYLNIIQFILASIDIDMDTHKAPHESINLTNIERNYTKSTKPILLPTFTTEAIYAAFKIGRLDIIKLLLALPNNDPTLKNYHKFIVSAALHFDVIKFLLLEIPGVNVNNLSIHVLFYASMNGLNDTVKFLLSKFPDISTYSTVNPNRNYAHAIEAAAFHGHLEVIKLLLEGQKEIGNVDFAVVKACEGGHLEVVRTLMKMVPEINVGSDNNLAIKSAAECKHFHIVKFLAGLEGVDVSVEDDYVLRTVARFGDLGTVKVLLEKGGVDPTAFGNEAIRNAAMGGHEALVKFLLTFPGVDLRSSDDAVFSWGASQSNLETVRLWLLYSGVSASHITEYCLPKAIDGGHLDIVKMLVKFSGVDVTFDDNAAVRRAAKNGNAKLVEYLMGIPGVDVTGMDNDAMANAVVYGHLDVVNLLLTAPGVDAAVNDNEFLKLAADCGHVEVVNLLLRLPEVDASAEDYYALQLAALRGHLDIVRMLLDVTGVDATVADNEVFILAAEGGHEQVVQLLLDHVRDSNEYVRLVEKAGAGEYVNMFRRISWDGDGDERKVRREKCQLRRLCDFIMNRNQPTSSSSPPFSLWDLLPIEIKEQIFNFTDIPTRFINNQPVSKSEIYSKAQDIWVAVINSNWDGDLTVLPDDMFPTILNGLEQIASKEGYQRVCQLRPKLAGLEYLQQVFDDDHYWNALNEKPYHYNESVFDDSRIDHTENIPKLFIHIPMRQYWKKELMEILSKADNLKLLFVVGSCGHFELFQDLYNEIFSNQQGFNTITLKSNSVINASKLMNYIIRFAAERGYINIIQFLLTKLNLNKSTSTETDPPAIPFALDKSLTTDAISEAFSNGHADIMNLLLPLPNYDPTFQQYYKFLPRAVFHVNVIKFMLQDMSCDDATARSRKAFCSAAEHGATETVMFLLSSYPDIKPCYITNAIREASKGEHLQIVELLLGYNDRIDVLDALHDAAIRGYVDIVKVLIKVPGADVGRNKNATLIAAAKKGHFDIVKPLVDHPTVDVTLNDNEVFRMAAKYGELELVKVLLAKKGVIQRLKKMKLSGKLLKCDGGSWC